MIKKRVQSKRSQEPENKPCFLYTTWCTIFFFPDFLGMISCLSSLLPGRSYISFPVEFQILAWSLPVPNLRSNGIFVDTAAFSYIRLVREDLSFKPQYRADREINKIKESSLNLNL